MLYDVVLGGVLSATFIPVFVDRLANKEERDAFDSISAVLTVSVVVLLGTTLAALIAAPYLITALTAADPHAGAGQLHHLVLERQVATDVPALVRDPDRRLRPLRTRRRVAQHAPALRRGRLGTDRQQPRLHRHPGLVRPLGRTGRRPGQRRGAPLPAGPARPGHLARCGAPGRGPHSQPAPIQSRAAALALESPRRRAARRGPARRMDLRLRPGQPDRPLRRHRAGRQRPRPRSGVLVYVRLRLLPASLRRRRRHGHVRGHARPGPALVDGAAGGVLASHERRAPGDPGSHHPVRRRHAPPGPSRSGPPAGIRPQHAGPDGTTGAALAMFALGLPGFCTYLYLVRVLQSMQRTRVAFYLYLVENGINIVLALLLSTRWASAAWPSRSRSPTRSPPSWPWPSSASGSGAWPLVKPGPRCGAWSSPASRWPSSSWSSRTSRARPAPSACWPGWSVPCSPAASPSAPS